MNEALFTPKQLTKTFNVTNETLIRWEKNGKIKAQKTKGGHRRYIYDVPNVSSSKDCKDNKKTSFIYARVSSAKQKMTLKDKLNSYNPNIQTMQLSKTLDQASVNYRVFKIL